MTRIDRREFSSLADAGGSLRVSELPAPVLAQLSEAGVSQADLTRIAGDDVISGSEFNALYEALAVRADGRGRPVDHQVSDSLFRSLAARVERGPGASGEPLEGGSGRSRLVGVSASAVDEAADLRGRTDGTRPCWFVSAMESIAEFFVELFGGNFVTSGERDEDLGRRMARERPETLRAILGQPGGEEALRQRLLAQRPASTSQADWNRTVNDVLRGLRAGLAQAPDLPDDVGRGASLRVRDRAAALFADDSSSAARQRLGQTVDALARSGLSEQTQLRLLESWAASGRTDSLRQNLDGLARGLTGRTPEVRQAALAQVTAHPERLPLLAELTQNPGFARVSPETQRALLARLGDPRTTSAEARQLLTRLSQAHEGRLQPLNEVLFGSRTLAAGARGPEVLAASRYLRALHLDSLLPAETSSYDAAMTAAVTEYQRRSGLLGQPPAAQAGVIDQVTLRRMQDDLRAQGVDPAAYRFSTELSLNRPTRAEDGPWRATQRWTPALEQEFSAFAEAYVRARVPTRPDGAPRRPAWEERVDCADLSYEALIQFARQRNLPVYLSAGGRTYSHASRGPIARSVESDFGAMHLQHFTRPIGPNEAVRTGDLGNMRWAQSANGHDSHYWHSHNVIGFDPLFREASVVYGSLDDLVRQPALDRFNGRGFNLTLHDVPETTIIDGINDDSGQGRQVDRAEQERRVRALLEGHTTGGHRVSDADVGAFITLVGNEANLHRNAPTAVSEVPQAFHQLVEGAPWADPAARQALVADLNRRFGASFTEADIDRLVAAGSRSEVTRVAGELVASRVPADRQAGAQQALIDGARGTVRFSANRDALSDAGMRAQLLSDFRARFGRSVSDAQVMQILNAGSTDEARAAALRIVTARGVPEGQREQAVNMLVEGADATRRLRRWDFDMFNRHM